MNQEYSWINEILVTSDGKKVVSASSDNTIKIWSLTGELLNIIEAHADGVSAVALHPDGKRLVSCSAEDDVLKVWNLNSGKLLHTIEGHKDGIYAIALHPDGERIISGSEDRTIKIWELNTGQNG